MPLLTSNSRYWRCVTSGPSLNFGTLKTRCSLLPRTFASEMRRFASSTIAFPYAAWCCSGVSSWMTAASLLACVTQRTVIPVPCASPLIRFAASNITSQLLPFPLRR